jgi:hypothetical protein
MIPPLDKFCKQHDADVRCRRFCRRMLELSGQNWRTAETSWQNLIEICLRDIEFESGDARLREATRIAMNEVLGGDEG